MTLIKSISGIRGTIGGKVGDGLNPVDITRFTAAYATLIRSKNSGQTGKIVVGRDARISGEMVNHMIYIVFVDKIISYGRAGINDQNIAARFQESGACNGGHTIFSQCFGCLVPVFERNFCIV